MEIYVFSCLDKTGSFPKLCKSYPSALWEKTNKYYGLSHTVKEKPIPIITIDGWINLGEKQNTHTYKTSCSILGN